MGLRGLSPMPLSPVGWVTLGACVRGILCAVPSLFKSVHETQVGHRNPLALQEFQSGISASSGGVNCMSWAVLPACIRSSRCTRAPSQGVRS